MEHIGIAENHKTLDMAEVASPNAESQLQPGEQTQANRRSSLVRSLSFKYYIHDSVPTLRFQLIGDLRASNLTELNGSWETARPTLRLRRFVLDVSRLYSSDDDGLKWLHRMSDAGAVFFPADYLESSGLHATPVRTSEQVAVKLSLFGRALGKIRGPR